MNIFNMAKLKYIFYAFISVTLTSINTLYGMKLCILYCQTTMFKLLNSNCRKQSTTYGVMAMKHDKVHILGNIAYDLSGDSLCTRMFLIFHRHLGPTDLEQNVVIEQSYCRQWYFYQPTYIYILKRKN